MLQVLGCAVGVHSVVSPQEHSLSRYLGNSSDPITASDLPAEDAA
jgi:hypothetical protein